MELFFAPWFLSFALLVAGVQYYIGCFLVGSPIPFRGLKSAGYMMMSDSYKVLATLFILNAFMFFVTSQAPFLESVIVGIRHQAQSAIEQAVSAHSMNIVAVIVLGLVVFTVALIRYLIEDILTFNFVKIILDIHKAMKQGASAANTLAGILAPLSMVYGILVVVQSFFVMFAQLIFYNWAWLAGLGVLFYLLPFRVGRRAGLLLIGFSIVSYLMLPLYGGFFTAFQAYVTERYWLAQVFPINLAVFHIIFPIMYFGFVSWLLVGLGALGWTPLRFAVGMDWSQELASFARGLGRAATRAASALASGIRGLGEEEEEGVGRGRYGEEAEGEGAEGGEEVRGRRGAAGGEEEWFGGRRHRGTEEEGWPSGRHGPVRPEEPGEALERERGAREVEGVEGRSRGESIEEWYERTRTQAGRYDEGLGVTPEAEATTRRISTEPEVFEAATSRTVGGTRLQADRMVSSELIGRAESTLMGLPEEDVAAMRNIQLRREVGAGVLGAGLGMGVGASLLTRKEQVYDAEEKEAEEERAPPTRGAMGELEEPSMMEYYPSLQESCISKIPKEDVETYIRHDVGHGTFSENLPTEKQEEWNKIWQEMKESGYLDSEDVPWEAKVSPQEGYSWLYDKYMAMEEGLPEKAEKFFDGTYEVESFEPRRVRRKLPRRGVE